MNVVCMCAMMFPGTVKKTVLTTVKCASLFDAKGLIPPPPSLTC